MSCPLPKRRMMGAQGEIPVTPDDPRSTAPAQEAAMADIIRARDEDWSLVREIRLRSLSSDPSAFGNSWEKESTYEDSQWQERVRKIAWFLAVENGTPIGVVASRRELDGAENERELQGMWVTPAHRGTGLSHKLAEAVLGWAKEDGADTVTLFVSPRNETAYSVYESLGFKDTGERWEVDEDDPEGAWHKLSRGV